MGTLAHCLKLHDIPRGQARQIEEWARQYRDEGYPGPDATAKAVQDLIARTTKDRDGIVASIKEEAPAETAGTAVAEVPVVEKVEPPKPAGPTPIPKVQGREFYSLPRAVTPAQDAAYLAAVEKGDMAAAQRMVDEAAKRKGLVKELMVAAKDNKSGGGDIYAFVPPKNTNLKTMFDMRWEKRKSADPVTYDDAGKVIPLSKRFDETTADIRYSLPSVAKDAGKGWKFQIDDDARKIIEQKDWLPALGIAHSDFVRDEMRKISSGELKPVLSMENDDFIIHIFPSKRMYYENKGLPGYLVHGGMWLGFWEPFMQKKHRVSKAEYAKLKPLEQAAMDMQEQLDKWVAEQFPDEFAVTYFPQERRDWWNAEWKPIREAGYPKGKNGPSYNKTLKAGRAIVERHGLTQKDGRWYWEDRTRYSAPRQAPPVDKYQRVIDRETGKPKKDWAGWFNTTVQQDPWLNNIYKQLTAAGYAPQWDKVFARHTEQEMRADGMDAYRAGKYRGRDPSKVSVSRDEILALGAMRRALAEDVRAAERAYHSTGNIADRAHMIAAIQRLAGVHAAVQGAKAEAARALYVARFIDEHVGEVSSTEKIVEYFAKRGIELTEAEIEQMTALEGGDPAEMLKFINGLIAKHRQFTAFEWIDAFRYFNMLSGTNTHAYNFISNLAWSVQEALTNVAATGVDTLKGIVTGKRELFWSDLGAGYAGYMRGLPLGAKAFVDILRRGYSDLQAADVLEDIDKYGGPREAPGGGRNILNWTSRLLSAADAMFSTPAYEGARARVASRLANKRGKSVQEILEDAGLSGEIHMEAQAESRRATFTDAATSQKVANFLMRVDPTAGRITRMIFPFLRVAENITRRGLGYTPGLGLLRSWKGEGKAQQIVAEQLVGTGLLAVAYLLAEAGKIVGAPPEKEDERDRWYREGNQPYSVNIGGTWVRWNRLGPLAFPFAAGLALRERNKKGLAKDQSKIMADIGAMGASMGKMVANMSMLQAFGQLAYAINDPGKYGGRAAGTVVGQFVPAAAQLRQWEKAFDPTLRDPQEWYEKIMTGVPLADKFVPPRYDKLGGITKRQDTGAAAFSPFVPIKPETDPIWKILDELEIDLDRPSKQWKNKDGTETVLTEKEWNQFKKEVGGGVRAAVTEHMRMNPGYTKHTLQHVVDRTQTRLIKRWKRDYKETE